MKEDDEFGATQEHDFDVRPDPEKKVIVINLSSSEKAMKDDIILE